MTFFTNSNFKKAAVLIGFLASSADALDAVNLGTAGAYAILSKAGVTTTGVTAVSLGNIGTSPISAGALTGFGMIMDSSNTFSTSSLLTNGTIYAADYTSPTPSSLTTAISDMQTAYTDAATRPGPDHLDLGAGSIEGLTLDPGLYKWGTSVGFTSHLYFNGNATDIWILQIDKSLIVGSGAIIHLTGAAKAENIFWQIAETADVGTTAHLEGVFLCKTNIALKTGSSLNGAALAQTAVTLDATTIVKKSKSV